MNIVVLTKHYVKNYGSVLQTLATQEVLGQFCDNVYIANYVRKEAIGANFMSAVLKNRDTGSKIKTFIYKAMLWPTIIKWEKVFGDFTENYLNITGDMCTSAENLYDEMPKADIYCTGSDMVWNDDTNGGFLPAYFLEFVPDSVKKISFAASFGKDDFPADSIEILKNKLNRYSNISVRESSAVSIVQNMGLTAANVLDPTLCMPKDFWRKFVKRNKYGKYLLIYQLTSSRKFDEYAKRIAKDKNVKIIRICTRYDNAVKCGRSVLLPSVEEWITLFWHAKYIITDSFHGTAFSINLNKDVAALPPRQYEGRLKSILELLNISERYVTDYSDYSVFDKPINYNEVNKLLDIKRTETIDFLKKAIEE